jgi:hypothetical protein
LLRRQVRQNIGKVARDVSSGGEWDPLVAIAADRYFPTSDVEIREPAPR